MTGVSGDSREEGVSGTSGTGGCWRLASVLRDARRSVLQFHVYLFIYFSSVKSFFPSRVCGTTS